MSRCTLDQQNPLCKIAIDLVFDNNNRRPVNGFDASPSVISNTLILFNACVVLPARTQNAVVFVFLNDVEFYGGITS